MRIYDALIVPIGTISLVGYISKDVKPRYAIRCSHESRVGYRSKRLANV